MTKRKNISRAREIITENKQLKKDYLSRVKVISDVMGLVKETLVVAKEVKTAEKAMKERATQNSGSNHALKAWKKAVAYSLEETKKGIAGFTLSVAMNAIMELDARSQKIPWAHYDFINQFIYYSPAAAKFLNVKEKIVRANIFELLGYIKREDIPKIRESLEEGYGLSHHKVFTSEKYGKRSKELMLSTYPFKYEEKPLGVAIFLRDPKISFHSRGLHKFEQEIQNVAKVSLEDLTQHKSSWEAGSSSPNL